MKNYHNILKGSRKQSERPMVEPVYIRPVLC